MEQRTYVLGGSRLTLVLGDITSAQTDVIVSSDDAHLTMGGGVSRAIHRAAGDSILADAAKLVPGRPGDVLVTTAGRLPCKFIFHAVTIGGDFDPAAARYVVRTATVRALGLLDALGLRSIAFPAIGAGVAGFSYGEVAVEMADAMTSVLASQRSPKQVSIYLYDRFGRMNPMDFIPFFEEFARRADALGGSELRETAPRTPLANREADGKRQSLLEARRRLLELEEERAELERRLVQSPAPAQSEIKKELGRVQDDRLAVLRESDDLVGLHGQEVFISYAHEDEGLRAELGDALSPLSHRGVVRMWHDREIRPGQSWESAIDERLQSAAVVLLLISSSFLASRYCMGVELKSALARHEREEAVVVPVILRPALWANQPFSHLQALPREGKPVTTWSNRDEALLNVAQGLETVFRDLSGPRHGGRTQTWKPA